MYLASCLWFSYSLLWSFISKNLKKEKEDTDAEPKKDANKDSFFMSHSQAGRKISFLYLWRAKCFLFVLSCYPKATIASSWQIVLH